MMADPAAVTAVCRQLVVGVLLADGGDVRQLHPAARARRRASCNELGARIEQLLRLAAEPARGAGKLSVASAPGVRWPGDVTAGSSGTRT